MPTVETIDAILVLDASRFYAELNKVNKEAGNIGVVVSQGSQDIQRSMASNAVSVAALGAAMYGTVDAASRFEAGMRTLNTIAGYSEQQLAEYGDRLSTLSLDLGATTTAAQNAAAAFEIAGAGFTNAADNAAILDAVLMGATAGQVDAGKYAALMTGTLNAFGESADQAARYGDLFFRTIDLGQTTAAELSSSLGKVTPVAAAAGIKMEELGAVIAALTSSGTGTAEATEGLRGALSNLLAPSAQAKKELARLGLTVNQETLKNKGLIETLKEIAVANGSSAQSFKTILGDVQAFTAALSLTNDGGVKATSFLNQMGDAAGANAKALEQIAKTFDFSFKQMKVAMEAAAISIGQVFLPPLKMMMDVATSAIQTFLEIPEPIRDTGVAIAGVGAALVAAASAFSFLGLLIGGLGIAMNVAKVGSLALAVAQTQLGKAVLQLVVARARDSIALTSLGTAASAAANRLVTQAAAQTAVRTAADALATGQTAAAATTVTWASRIGPLLGSMVRLAGVVGLVAIGLSAWHKASTETIRKVAEQDRAVNAAAVRTRLLDDAFRSANTSAEQLMKEKTGAQLGLEIQSVRQAMMNLKESFDAGNLSAVEYERQLKKLGDTIQNLQGKQAALDAHDKEQIKLGRRSASSLSEEERKELVASQLSDIRKLSNAKEISAQQEIFLLNRVLEKAYVNAEERRRIEEQIASLRGELKTDDDKAAEDRRRNSFEEDLSAIKQLADAKELSARQEIAMLEEVLAKHRDITAEEERRVKEQIAGLKGKVKTYDAEQAEKAGKEAAKRAEKDRKETLDVRLAQIKALRTEGKISANEEINQLKRVLAEYNLTEAEKRRIHQQTLDLRSAANKKAVAADKKDEEKAKREAEDLSKARDTGADLQVGANERKVARLQEETERKGVDNRKKINDALKQNLVLQLQSIQREADRESVGVQSADLLAQIRANAEAKMREEIARTAEAQKQAADEQIAAMKRVEAEAKRKKSEFSLGGVTGIEDFAKSLEASKSTTSYFKSRDKDAPVTSDGQSVADIERQLTADINLEVKKVTAEAPALQAAITGLATALKVSPGGGGLRRPEPMATPVAAGTSGGARQTFSGSFDVRVAVSGPGQIEQAKVEAGLDGRYTEITRSSRGMSGRISFGGG